MVNMRPIGAGNTTAMSWSGNKSTQRKPPGNTGQPSLLAAGGGGDKTQFGGGALDFRKTSGPTGTSAGNNNMNSFFKLAGVDPSSSEGDQMKSMFSMIGQPISPMNNGQNSSNPFTNTTRKTEAV
jgi:hypothetical protein